MGSQQQFGAAWPLPIKDTCLCTNARGQALLRKVLLHAVHAVLHAVGCCVHLSGCSQYVLCFAMLSVYSLACFHVLLFAEVALCLFMKLALLLSQCCAVRDHAVTITASAHLRSIHTFVSN